MKDLGIGASVPLNTLNNDVFNQKINDILNDPSLNHLEESLAFMSSEQQPPPIPFLDDMSNTTNTPKTQSSMSSAQQQPSNQLLENISNTTNTPKTPKTPKNGIKLRKQVLAESFKVWPSEFLFPEHKLTDTLRLKLGKHDRGLKNKQLLSIIHILADEIVSYEL